MSHPFSVGCDRLSVWDEGFGRHSRFFGQLGLGFGRHRQFFGRELSLFGRLRPLIGLGRGFRSAQPLFRSTWARFRSAQAILSIVTFVLSTMAPNDRCGSLLIAETLFFFREMTVSESSRSSIDGTAGK
ncbi:hypothetical protein OYT88_04250 [Sporolactobacillus sp. CQH2019]|uniref:hypothetical protein n=1 Tax=Sporolactobacillus sp. CQH2019 TaxID=3023512 RepID=UPI00236872F8|nr:hypothetical protein [Sporolactobacillus sp. CQH2019]MDD9147762.1 hypothetical protein [Sporolactobacillus sp. CQH2019]